MLFAIRSSGHLAVISGQIGFLPSEVRLWLEKARPFEHTTYDVFDQRYELVRLPDVLTTYTCGQASTEEKSGILRDLVECLFVYAAAGYRCPECSFEGVHFVEGGWWKCPKCGHKGKKDEFKVVPDEEAEDTDDETHEPELVCPQCHTANVVIIDHARSILGCNECGFQGIWARFDRQKQEREMRCPRCRR